ncbi:MAG: hypothetical protein JXR83_17585 [Deltaproteobacteria bacterium]|nr:hypothetical protein [Deltaproteobacteria bacterium]
MMRSRSRWLVVLWTGAIAGALIGTSARADDAHYQNFAAGARGAMLGGAYAAIADDSSGLYFNPAGIVDVRRANLSISTSLYGFERQLALTDIWNLQRWADEFSRRPVTGAEINIIPASGGVAWAFGRQLPDGSFPHAVAAGAVVPAYRGSVHESVLRQDTLDVGTVSQQSDRTMYFSTGYGYRVGPWLRLGVSLHAAVRLVDSNEEFSALDTSTVAADPVFLSTSSRLSLTNASLLATFGVKLRPGRRWLVGAALTTPSLSVFQRGTFAVSSSRANFQSGDGSIAPTALEMHQYRVRWEGAELPLWSRLGVAYVVPVDYTLTFDVSLYAPTHYRLVADRCRIDYVSEVTPLCALLQWSVPTAGRLSEDVRRRSPIPVDVQRNFTVNVNAGAEKLMRDDLSIGIGAFTDFSSAPDYQVDGAGNLTPQSTLVSNVDHYGATFSVGYFGEHSLSRIGLMGALGLGQRARAVSPGSRFIETADLVMKSQPAQEFLIYVFWSSTFRYGEGRSRRSDAENAP